MILEKFVVGALETNCYVFGDDGSKEAVVIDPGGECQRIKDFIALHGLRLINVINTHGHGDHIICNGELGAAVLIHELDRDFLENPHLNLSMAFGARITSPKAGGLLKDGDRIRVGKLYLDVIHTPGHTPGCICLRYDKVLFSGDTLFFEGVGRTDLPDSSLADIIYSIKNKLMKLPGDCKVFPGHGPGTTIGHEIKNNMFMR